MSAIRERIAAVSLEIASATSRPIDLVVVTKTHPSEVVHAVAAAGAQFAGENYAQEVRDKASAIEAVRASGVSVQFIGQLQTNKVRMFAGLVDCVASVDRAPLVAEIAKRMPSTRIHLQVNATGEAQKGGCAVPDVPDLVARASGAGLSVDADRHQAVDRQAGARRRWA